IGFYSGLGLLNAIGGTRQMPNVIEIVTNKESSRVRKVLIGTQKFILRKARCEINNKNKITLQILELATEFEPSDEVNIALINYAKTNGIDIKKLLKYSKYYPAKTLKNLSEVLYELA
ncbi:MAG: hypothetical protein LBM99_04490, partial [Bacillales bacterium]|nr:hypothetical protein [Bacillales bacterium]